jgi:hypothetical protein
MEIPFFAGSAAFLSSGVVADELVFAAAAVLELAGGWACEQIAKRTIAKNAKNLFIIAPNKLWTKKPETTSD